ncbi:hypothetical protein [Aestuariibaculum sediminum]|uniref:Antibiotic biosynthesis monooxygenase n=1 Tax=Aestuariibaculum sediminum TaxID=2770637 RepID=A0A8J6PY07_9FLAO|nr:hypothetical protein [Aestuariibaculum sediminum]MBD0830872.1 hypothetical protein [Aestuariibaculum sediminum]
MKTTNQLFAAMLTLLFTLYATNLLAQGERPMYISVTKAHWNMNYEDFDMDTWKSVEKEYLEKVTKKNEHRMGFSVYLHQMTPSNSDILFVSVYKTWEDIAKAADKDEELAEAAWPDEAERKAFMKKQRAYYSPMHSDEIYYTLPNAKIVPEGNDDDLILYLRTTHWAFPSEYDEAELKSLMDENFEVFIKDNKLIKGYYPNRHAWGSDSTEIVEGYFLESLADLDKMFDSFSDLAEKKWPNESDRVARGKKMGKYFTPEHGDAVYKLVAELSK